jgi:hypothetical protein
LHFLFFFFFFFLFNRYYSIFTTHLDCPFSFDPISIIDQSQFFCRHLEVTSSYMIVGNPGDRVYLPKVLRFCTSKVLWTGSEKDVLEIREFCP